MARPLVYITLCYVLGIVLGYCCFSLLASIYFLMGALLWLVFNLLLKREGLQVIMPVLLLFLAVGSLALNLSLQKFSGSMREFAGEKCTLAGMVDDEPLWQEEEAVFPLRAEKLIFRGEEQPISGTVRVVLQLDGLDWGGGAKSKEKDGGQGGQATGVDKRGNAELFPSLSYGRAISLEGVLYEPKERRNPGGFDYRFFLEARGMSAIFYSTAKEIKFLGFSEELSRLRRAALQVKDKMSAVLRSCLPEREGNLLTGMLFGERRMLDADTERIFRTSGLSHLLAVSGLHVGLFAGVLFLICRRLRIEGWPGFLFILALLFAYIFLCGLKPATLRAFIMIVLAMGAVYLGRSGDFYTALAAAALVTLIYNPLLLFSASFQLSYAATLSIFLFAPVLKQKIFSLLEKRALLCTSFPADKVSSLIAVTLAAQLGTAPLTAYYFQEVSLLALFSNVLILPAISLVPALGLFAALLGLFFPPAGSLLNLANYPLLAYILFVAGKIGNLPFSSCEVFPPRLGELLLYYAGLFFIFTGGGKKIYTFYSRFSSRLRTFHLLTILLLIVLVISWWGVVGHNPQLEVVFLDVGQGDAVFISTPQGQNILLDAGGKPAYLGDIEEQGHFVVVPFLKFRRVRKLDLVIVSHPHEDHYGGVFSVLEKFPVKMLVTNADLPQTKSYHELLDLAAEKNISREILHAGDSIILGPSLNIKVLSPPLTLFNGTESDANNNSLVLHLRFKEIGFLFTGDIESKAVDYLLEQEKLQPAQILKIPHHGGDLPNLPQFLQKVAPRLAVISVGANSFGHPHTATLGSLMEKGIEIYRTDLHGAVMIHSDGSIVKAKTMLSPALGRL